MDDQMNQVGVGPHEAERAQGSGAVAPGRGGRMSRQRKSAAVLRLLRGEDLETVSRELGVTAAMLTGWRDAFLAAGEAALMSRAVTGEELESERLKARLGAALIGKPYGVAAVCRVWRLARSGVYRHLSAPPAAQRRGPLGAMSDDALTTAIQGVL